MSAHERSKTTLRIACKDVVPGCGVTAEASTEDELMDKVARHAANDHHVHEVTPELSAKIKAAIRRE